MGDNIKINLKRNTCRIVRCGVDRSGWRWEKFWAFVGTVTNLWVPQIAGNFLTSWGNIRLSCAAAECSKFPVPHHV